MSRRMRFAVCFAIATFVACTSLVAQSAAAGTGPIFDGHVSKLEYSDARHFVFTNGHGEVDVYVKIADGCLCFAFVIPDDTYHTGDDMVVMLDTKNARQEAPGKDDLRAYVRRKTEHARMHVGDGKEWVDQYGPWEYRSTSYASGWEMECRIPLQAIGVTGKTTLGFALRIWDNEPQKVYNWPTGSKETEPKTWGTLVLDATKILDVTEKP